jgi:hypothetical protein
MTFGSRNDERAWVAEVDAMRAAMGDSEHVIAPRCSLSTVRGELTAGEPITAGDLAAETGPDGHVRSPRVVLELHVRRGVVLSR